MPKQRREVRSGSSKPGRAAAQSKPRAPRPAAKAKPRAATARPAASTKARASAKTTRAKARPAAAKKARASAKTSRATARVAKPARKPARLSSAQAPAAARRERRRTVPETLRLRSLMAALTVGDLERSIHFYVEGLGFSVKERWERDGRLMGVMLRAGTCKVGLDQDDWAKGRDRVKGVGFRLYAETAQSLEAIAARAREHGIAVQGPKTAWGVEMVEVEDPDGFKLTIQQTK